MDPLLQILTVGVTAAARFEGRWSCLVGWCGGCAVQDWCAWVVVVDGGGRHCPVDTLWWWAGTGDRDREFVGGGVDGTCVCVWIVCEVGGCVE